MKKTLLRFFSVSIIIFMLLLFIIPGNLAASPADIVVWNFSDGNQVADGGITANLTRIITASHASSYTYPVGPTSGSSAISATGWDGGAGTKYWEIEFNTEGYSDLNLSFSQRSSATGPRDFKLQYKIGAGGTWTDIAGASFALGNNTWFNSTAYSLPAISENQSSVYLRWVMTSNISAREYDNVGSGGTNRITNIIVEGEEITPEGSITINKSTGSGINPGQAFNFELNTSPVQTASITGSGTAEFSGLAAGTYTITETTSGFNTQVSSDGVTWSSGSSIGVTITGDIGSEDSRDVYFNNDIILSAGKVIINKSIGSGVDPNQFFNFRINTSPIQTASITGSGTAEFSGLAAGAYTITETTSGFNTQVSSDGVTWSSGSSIDVTIIGDIGSEDSRDVYFNNEEDPGTGIVNIVKWNFLDEDQVADGGISENLNKTISLSFEPAIFTYYTGPGGGQTRAIAADSWDNGANDKNWMVEFNTENYSDLKLSFSQRSSPTGPRDFNLQYKIGESGSWVTFDSISLPGDNFLNVFNLSLPSAVYNQPSVFLRWIMSSNTSARGYDEVGPLGTNRITNIIVSVGKIEEGEEISGADDSEVVEIVWIRDREMTCYHVWVNDKNNFEFVFFWEYKNNNWVKIYNMEGTEVFAIDMPYGNARFEADLPDGMYTVKTFHSDFKTPIQEFITGKP